MSPADAISLYTIDGDGEDGSLPDEGEPDESESRPNVEQNEEYLETPPAFLEVTTIKTPPVYAPPSWALSTWTRLSNALFNPRLVVLLLLWACLLLHEASVVRASTTSSTSDTDAVWHAFLATIMSYGLAHAYLWKKRQASQTTPGYESAPLTGTVAAAICIMAALVCMPIMQFQTLHLKTTTSLYKRNDPELACATLTSWEQALPNLRGSLPSRIQLATAKDLIRDIAWDSTDHWMVSDKSNRTLHSAHAMQFSNLGGGRGVGENCWNGAPCRYEDGVYMPVFPLTKSTPSSRLLGTRWSVETQVLLASLLCEHLEVGHEPEVERTGEQHSMSLRVEDTAGCSVTATLPAFIYDDVGRASLQRTLAELENGAQGRDMLEALNYYRRLLLDGDELVAYRPSWVRMDPNDTKCSQKIAIVGLTPVALPAQATPKSSQIQAAVCKPAFVTASVKLLLELNKTSLYHEHLPFESWDRPLPFDHVAPLYETLFPGFPELGLPGFDLPFEPKWEDLEPDIRDRLIEDFLQHASRTSIPGSLWPFSHLREEMGTYVWKRPNALGSLLMSGRLLRLSFLTKLSAAAGLALHERLDGADPSGEWTSALRPANTLALEEFGVTKNIFQARWSFRIVLFVTSLTLTWCLIFLLAPEDGMTVGGRSVLPWDVTSVAAKATLLRHSPVRQWIASCRPGNSLPTGALKDMRIGYWHTHKLQGQSGWRIDYPQVEIPTTSNSTEIVSKYKSHHPDHVALHHLITSARHMGVALAIAIIGPWLTSAWSQPMPVSSQLVRLLDVAELRVTASVWSVLVSRLLPSMAILYVCFVWLPKVHGFLYQRQPWAALKVPQPSNKSITLDYQNTRFPVILALKNRQGLLVAMTVGCILGLVAPTMQTILYKWTVETQHAEPIQATSNRVWAKKLKNSQSDINALSRDALSNLADSLLTSRTLPQYSSPTVSIPGIDLSRALPKLQSPFASFETSALRAGLDCEETSVKVTFQKGTETGTPAMRIQSITHGHEGQQKRFERPCWSPSSFGAWGPADRDGEATETVECIRWWLDDSAADDASTTSPRWLIISSSGTGRWSSQQQDLLFTGPVRTLSLSCLPRLQLESGVATMQLQGHGAEQPPIVKYEASGGPRTEMEPEIIVAISQGLNQSNSVLDGHNGGMIADEELLHTELFVGDTLGYLLYRFACQGRPPCADRKRFSHDISRIFATYVSILAGRSDVLQVSQPRRAVDMHPFHQREVIKTGLLPRIYLACFTVFCAGLALVAGARFQFYKFPVPPEYLDGGMQLLCGSSIVDTLESEVKDPEMLSLRKLYDVVDRWGFMYKLGQVKIGGRVRHVVDVVSAFDEADEAPERYEDEPEDESEDEPEDESTTSD